MMFKSLGFFFTVVACAGCSEYVATQALADQESPNSEGLEAHRGLSDLDRLPNAQIRIEAPAQNSKIKKEGFTMGGTCNIQNGAIEISLENATLAKAVCHSGRWVSPTIAYDQFPKGPFQLFVGIKSGQESEGLRFANVSKMIKVA